MTTTCNNCMEQFDVESDCVQTVTIDGLEIQYFICPACGKKYAFFAANAEMKHLVEERVQIQKKLKTAHLGKFRQKTTRQLISEQTKVVKRQKKLWEQLKPKAEQLLRGVQVLGTAADEMTPYKEEQNEANKA